MPPSSIVLHLTDIIGAIEHLREKVGTSSLEAFKQDWNSSGSSSAVSKSSPRPAGPYRTT
jgi:hypothetical protein